MDIVICPLGAGQDVGKSCILVSFVSAKGSRTIMFDCGAHMGFKDGRKFPDFRKNVFENLQNVEGTGVSDGVSFAEVCDAVDLVLVSHFHLDHIGGLPIFTERNGYKGRIFMSLPTKLIAPVLLSDFAKVNTSSQKRSSRQRSIITPPEGNFSGERESGDRVGAIDFSLQDVSRCMEKVETVALGATIQVRGFQITPCRAGHVLGAVMWFVRDIVSGKSVMYTGDYNMAPDRHMAPALPELGCISVYDKERKEWKVSLDVLITESTYGLTVRSPRTVREKSLVEIVLKTVKQGGKVLIPVFALGRAQELCLIIDSVWERLQLDHIPVYLPLGLASKVLDIYAACISWTNSNIQRSFATKRNSFNFRYIKELDNDAKMSLGRSGPCVVFATPGMLHGGLSLDIFKVIAPSRLNCVILPGYCQKDTVGNRIQVLSRDRSPGAPSPIIRIDKQDIPLCCSVHSVSFSAHVDYHGILLLLQQCLPRHVVAVHGDPAVTTSFAARIGRMFKNMNAHAPKNEESVFLRDERDVEMLSSTISVPEATWSHAENY